MLKGVGDGASFDLILCKPHTTALPSADLPCRCLARGTHLCLQRSVDENIGGNV